MTDPDTHRHTHMTNVYCCDAGQRAAPDPCPWHPDGLRRDGHAANCDGPDDWHHPVSGHCGDCGCFTCGAGP